MERTFEPEPFDEWLKRTTEELNRRERKRGQVARGSAPPRAPERRESPSDERPKAVCGKTKIKAKLGRRREHIGVSPGLRIAPHIRPIQAGGGIDAHA